MRLFGTWMTDERAFDLQCTRCPRLAGFLREVRAKHSDYHARPVAPFGAANPQLLIVGLAPGMHGANRTGRPFTGDHAGILLYSTLYAAGLANRAESLSADDALRLRGVRITNAVKCLPPANKPQPDEIKRCNNFLRAELASLGRWRAILALGRVAHEAVLAALDLKRSAFAFAHAAEHVLPAGGVLIDSFHCSRYNTQTRRLTTPMFERVVLRARDLAGLGEV
jgi:uracil-DNA glycosylase family 4